jgi:hypothetical protein
MTPNDLLKVAFPTGQEFPVSPHPHLFYETENKSVYTGMMAAILKYKKACADAESTMYSEVLDALSKEKDLDARSKENG